MEIGRLLLLFKRSERVVLFSIIIQSFVSYASLFILIEDFKTLPAYQEIILSVAFAIVSLTGAVSFLFIYSYLFKINVWYFALWLAIVFNSGAILYYGVDFPSPLFYKGMMFTNIFPATLLGLASLLYIGYKRKKQKANKLLITKAPRTSKMISQSFLFCSSFISLFSLFFNRFHHIPFRIQNLDCLFELIGYIDDLYQHSAVN